MIHSIPTTPKTASRTKYTSRTCRFASVLNLLTADKWGVGPTVVVLRQQGPWTYGLLGNHIWSFAGNDSRADISDTLLQPFLSYTTSYYNIASGSYGLQAGVQTIGYVLALMTDEAVENVEIGNGWELGVGPSIVIVDAGIAKTLTTETAKADVYAFTFGQEGLMGGMGLQGTKVTRLNK
ncbi:MAG: hypothetical protein ACI96M_004152 [Candidatus Azotimanducaceae bacterium]|jgi:hypothetical protein